MVSWPLHTDYAAIIGDTRNFEGAAAEVLSRVYRLLYGLHAAIVGCSQIVKSATIEGKPERMADFMYRPDMAGKGRETFLFSQVPRKLILVFQIHTTKQVGDFTMSKERDWLLSIVRFSSSGWGWSC